MTRMDGSGWIVLVLLAACGGETKTDPPAPSSESQALEAPSPGPAPASKLAANSHCATVCTRSTALGCPAASRCEAMCSESMQGSTCQAEKRAVNECMSAQPASNWACTDDGIAAIKAGFCDTEQAAYAKCLTRESN